MTDDDTNTIDKEHVVFSGDAEIEADYNQDKIVNFVEDIGTDYTYEGSLSFDIDGERVECPDCEQEVTVPADRVLALFIREPTPCPNCGYPLL